jgi:hypothetical protein
MMGAEEIIAVSTIDSWAVSCDNKLYLVSRMDDWQEGKQSWKVIEIQGKSEVHLHLDYDKEVINKIIRLVQEHLVR